MAESQRVLVVDDDCDVRALVRQVLEREGFEVAEAASGEEAIRLVDGGGLVDVAVLDLTLPGISGFDVLAELRDRDPTLHVIILTGSGGEADRVRGLLRGADDYVVKPFSVRELAARVVAGARRRARLRGADGAAGSCVVEHGGLRVDPTTRVATLDGEPVRLTPKEFDLLFHFASNPRRAFTRDELLHQVWASSAEWQAAATVTEHVRRLRLKIETDPSSPERIVTVRPNGYRFEPPAAGPAWVQADPTVRSAVLILVEQTIVDVTEAFLDLVGAPSADAVIGREIWDFVAPGSVAAVAARYDEITTGRAPRPEIITMRCTDGTTALVEIATSFVSWNGKPARQVTVWDLTGTRRLQELATGVRTALTDAVVVADADLRVQSCNRAAEDLYGWVESEVLGRSVMEVAPPTTEGDGLAALLRDGNWHGELVHRRRDGSPVSVLASTTAVRNRGGQTIGLVTVSRVAGPGTASFGVAGGLDEEERALAADLRRGLDAGELVLHFQPIVTLADGAWIGLEALVRWQHPTRGLLAPAGFMDVAERSGAVVDLGTFVLEAACRQAAAWRAKGRPWGVSVNLSAQQLGDPSLVERVMGALDRAGVPADGLWLEVTETSLVRDLDQASAVLQRLADAGVRISIDDFGTGWASLTYLRAFPIGSLKIDRLFVEGLASEGADAAIVTSILTLGAELGLVVTAEGIETEEQRAALLRLGCQYGQGYLFGRPALAASIVDGAGGGGGGG